jgi:hypothetical protein
MILVVAVAIVLVVLLFTLRIRDKDLPAPDPVSPVQHLEERKARIYENLRDLNFEYRVGKLSDEDYQRTKSGLQQELAQVLAEVDQVLQSAAPPPSAVQAKAVSEKPGFSCPHCGAAFDKPMKFCGNCGKMIGAKK